MFLKVFIFIVIFILVRILIIKFLTIKFLSELKKSDINLVEKIRWPLNKK